MDASTTALSARCHGQTVTYALGLEFLPLRTADGTQVGTLSAFSYVADVAAEERQSRPILFLTNGGPGSASAYLHLSGIAPFRAAVPDDLSRGVHPPYGLEESSSSLLDIADLVFIDAPLTGFGDVDEGTDMDQFYSVEADAGVFGTAIAEWITARGRWNSPKYFVGESYGTHRAAFLASATHGIDPVPLDGIALLGQAVNIQEVAERPGNVIGALANVPYKAAAAWFHGVGSREYETVEQAIGAALDFAWTDLALAMLQGTALPPHDLRVAAERLAVMIGIPADELVASRLWISKGDFRHRLLKDGRRTIGANDSRYSLAAPDAAFGEQSIDPAATHLGPRYVAALHLLLRRVGITADRPYRMFDASAAGHWDWDESGSALFMRQARPSPFHTYPYPARLSRWMKQAPEGRIFIGTGIYDSLTTIGAADHLIRQWDLPRDRVEHRWYDGGHMMYSNPAAAAQLTADLRTFLASGPAR